MFSKKALVKQYIPKKIINIYDELVNSKLFTNIEYQRDIVWPEKNQITLIKELFKDFDIGTIYISRRIINGKMIDVVMDGKQRLTSLKNFMDNKLCIEDKKNKVKMYYSNIPNQPSKSIYEYKTLTSIEKDIFDNKMVMFLEYLGLDELTERAIFISLQNGMCLTEAEKLNASTSQIMFMVKKLVKSYSNNLKDYLSDSRNQLDMLFIKIIYICYDKPLKGLAVSASLKKFVNESKIKKNKYNEAKKVMNKHCELITSIYKNNGVTKAVFIINTILINEFIDIMQNDQIIETCNNLQKILIDKYQTIAINSKQLQECIDYIEKINSKNEINDDEFIDDLSD